MPTVVIALSKFDPGADSQLNLSILDVDQRAFFYRSVLYNQVLKVRARARLAEAKRLRLNDEQARRLRILTELQTQELSDDERRQVDVSRTLQGDTLPAEAHLSMLLVHPQTFNDVCAWSPDHHLAKLAALVKVLVDLTTLAWEAFAEGAKLVVSAGQMATQSVANPTIRNVVEYASAIWSTDGPRS